MGQQRRALALLQAAEAAGEVCYVADPVLCELVWTLSYRYRLTKAQIVPALRQLLLTASYVFDDPGALQRAVDRYARQTGDFADFLIAERARARGARTVFTFDRALHGKTGFSAG